MGKRKTNPNVFRGSVNSGITADALASGTEIIPSTLITPPEGVFPANMDSNLKAGDYNPTTIWAGVVPALGAGNGSALLYENPIKRKMNDILNSLGTVRGNGTDSDCGCADCISLYAELSSDKKTITVHMHEKSSDLSNMLLSITLRGTTNAPNLRVVADSHLPLRRLIITAPAAGNRMRSVAMLRSVADVRLLTSKRPQDVTIGLKENAANKVNPLVTMRVDPVSMTFVEQQTKAHCLHVNSF